MKNSDVSLASLLTLLVVGGLLSACQPEAAQAPTADVQIATDAASTSGQSTGVQGRTGARAPALLMTPQPPTPRPAPRPTPPPPKPTISASVYSNAAS